ncbi:MAG: TonB-dependent receptor [Bacteroidales bacterium]|nr:TonB-dependent receptor [Bacteroidales bacterium]
MKKIVLIIASLTLSLNLIGQFIVKGVVLDSKDEPIAGANVYLKNTYDGTSTDSLGGFSFETSETGKQTLVVSFIGMKAVEKELELSHDYLNLQIQLKDDDSELQTIVISAGAFETGETVKSLVLKPMDIATTPSAVGDIYGALSSLPGSQIVGNEGGLFVRGGEGYETKTFVDGMPVVRPYMAKMPDIATRSNFSPLLFSGTVFSTGGYSAEFGQALSSALNLNTVGIANATESSLMLMSVGLNASHTQRWERSSLSVSLDYNDMGLYYPLVRKNMEWNRYPFRAGGTALYRMKHGKYGMVPAIGIIHP